MTKQTRIGLTLLAAGVLIGITPTPLHAYLDAGSGSMMVQLLLAGTAGVVVLAKLFWQRIVNGVKSLFHKKQS